MYESKVGSKSGNLILTFIETRATKLETINATDVDSAYYCNLINGYKIYLFNENYNENNVCGVGGRKQNKILSSSSFTEYSSAGLRNIEMIIS